MTAIVVRNAIFAALYPFETRRQSKRSRTFIEKQAQHVPRYREEPEFVPGFKRWPAAMYVPRLSCCVY